MIEIVKKTDGYVVRRTTLRNSGRPYVEELRQYGGVFFGTYEWYDLIGGDLWPWLWLAKRHAKRVASKERKEELKRIRRQSHVDHTVWTLPDAS